MKTIILSYIIAMLLLVNVNAFSAENSIDSLSQIVKDIEFRMKEIKATDTTIFIVFEEPFTGDDINRIIWEKDKIIKFEIERVGEESGSRYEFIVDYDKNELIYASSYHGSMYGYCGYDCSYYQNNLPIKNFLKEILEKKIKGNKVKLDTIISIINDTVAQNWREKEGKVLLDIYEEVKSQCVTKINIIRSNNLIVKKDTAKNNYLSYVTFFANNVIKGKKLYLFESFDANEYFQKEHAVEYLNDNKLILFELVDAIDTNRYFFDFEGNLICHFEIHSEPIYSKTFNVNKNDDIPIDYKVTTVYYYFQNGKNIYNINSANQEIPISTDFENNAYNILESLRNIRNSKIK